MSKYSLILKNNQGAEADILGETVKDCICQFNAIWDDTENLSAHITDVIVGELVAYKEYGKKNFTHLMRQEIKNTLTKLTNERTNKQTGENKS